MTETSIQEYLQNMPGGEVLSRNWQEGEPRLLITEGCVPSSLFDLVTLEIPELQRPDAAVGAHLVPPVVAQVVRWECEHAHSAPFDQLWRLTDLGPIPQWGSAMPEHTAALIATAHDLGDEDVVEMVVEIAKAHNADVVSVLSVVLDQYWQANDMVEFITAAATALATPTTAPV